MKVIISCFCLLLSGCFYQTVNSYDIELAAKQCKGLENVIEIQSIFDGAERVQCKPNNFATILRGE